MFDGAYPLASNAPSATWSTSEEPLRRSGGFPWFVAGFRQDTQNERYRVRSAALMADPTLRVMEHPPGYDDPADLFLRHPEPEAAWERMVAEAKPMPSWLIGKLPEQHDLATVRGRVNACEDMVDVLLRQHPIARMAYARELAAQLDQPLETVFETLDLVIAERLAYWRAHPGDRPGPPPRVKRQYPVLDRLDEYGESARFDCPWCGSESSAKASKPLDLWHCVVCDSSGKASTLREPEPTPAIEGPREAELRRMRERLIDV